MEVSQTMAYNRLVGDMSPEPLHLESIAVTNPRRPDAILVDLLV